MMFPHSVRIRHGFVLGGWLLALLASGAAPPAGRGDQTGMSQALIIVGLPGDDEHAARFDGVVKSWRDWLTGPLGFDPGRVRVLGGSGREAIPATREAITDAATALKQGVSPEDRLWVFWLGHANLDNGHAFLHLPGPDLREDQFGALFRGLVCRESVFWMTSACSGWFIQGLTSPGRIIISATERDQEINETEFPMALATVAAMPAVAIDANKDGKISVLELFQKTVKEVEARFGADKRIPTEHAQLDDNGDGKGTEAPNPKAQADSSDGRLRPGRSWPGDRGAVLPRRTNNRRTAQRSTSIRIRSLRA